MTNYKSSVFNNFQRHTKVLNFEFVNNGNVELIEASSLKCLLVVTR